MKRITILIISVAALAATLTACNKTPAHAAGNSSQDQRSGVASATSPAAPPAAAASAVVTYDCHSAQKGRDIFVRFDADGSLFLGADAADMKPTGDVVLFDKSGMASWSKKHGSWTETDSFDKNKAEWDWTNDPGPEGLVDHAHYYCKTV